MCSGHDLGSGLAILVRNQTLRVAIVHLVLGTSPLIDVVVITLLTLHDAMNGARRSILAIKVQTTSELPLLTFAMALINVAASVAATPVLVEVGT
jgi:hypothetical protein